jgi:signal transduction histidine kinase
MGGEESLMSGSTGGDPSQTLPGQDRWIWGVVTYAMLAVALGVCLADAGVTTAAKAGAAGLSALWALWYWLFVARSRSWRRHVGPRVISFVLSILIGAALSWIHEVFVLMLFSYYGVAFGALPLPWAIPTVVLSSLALAARFVDSRGGRSVKGNLLFFAGFLGMAFLDALLGLFIGSIVRQSRERQRMIEELERARGELARAEREAGMLEERQRLAGEIHDTLAQGFTGIVLQLESARGEMDVAPARVRPHIEMALRIARESLTEARRALWALRPEILDNEPFPEALRRVVRSWSETSGVPAEAAVTGIPRALAAPVEVALLRSAQEALANVAKHARARRLSVTLSYMDDEVAMDVQDDGCGFDPATPRGGGFGLLSMRERVESVGGSLSVESAPGEGTTLAVQIPLGSRGSAEVSS